MHVCGSVCVHVDVCGSVCVRCACVWECMCACECVWECMCEVCMCVGVYVCMRMCEVHVHVCMYGCIVTSMIVLAAINRARWRPLPSETCKTLSWATWRSHDVCCSPWPGGCRVRCHANDVIVSLSPLPLLPAWTIPQSHTAHR